MCFGQCIELNCRAGNKRQQKDDITGNTTTPTNAENGGGGDDDEEKDEGDDAKEEEVMCVECALDATGGGGSGESTSHTAPFTSCASFLKGFAVSSHHRASLSTNM